LCFAGLSSNKIVAIAEKVAMNETEPCEWHSCDQQVVFHLSEICDRRLVAERKLCPEHGSLVLERIEPRPSWWERPADTYQRVPCDLCLICYNQKENAALVSIREHDGDRCLLIKPVGIFEAACLLQAVKDPSCPAPLTHEVMRDIILALDGHVTEAVIQGLHPDGFYVAELSIQRGSDLMQIRIRPSDAISVAIYANAEVSVAEGLLNWVYPRSTDLHA
jgi:bifunctional DNase/RNase